MSSEKSTWQRTKENVDQETAAQAELKFRLVRVYPDAPHTQRYNKFGRHDDYYRLI